MNAGLFYLASAYCFRLDALDDVRRVQTFKIHIYVTTENTPLHKGAGDSGNNLQKETEKINGGGGKKKGKKKGENKIFNVNYRGNR